MNKPLDLETEHLSPWGKRWEIRRRLRLLLLLLKAVQLQRSFGLLNEFFPFGPVSDAVPPVCYFHICYVTFYIILPPVFRSS